MLKKTLFFLLISMVSNAQFLNRKAQLFSIEDQEEEFSDEFFCDACGCSASGGAMGFSSLLTQQFIGIRYLQQNYRSKEGIFNNSPWSKEQFNTIQLWARIPISKKIQLSALIPYHHHTQEKQSTSNQIAGLGDITLMGFYSLFKKKSDSLDWQHHLQIGSALKAPTGEYDTSNQGSVNPSFQVGTGSWDYSLLSEYIVQWKKWGLHSTLAYWIKSENEDQYRFGNQWNYSASVFYSFNKSWGFIIPQIGIAGEQYENNEQFSIVVPKTSGEILFGRIGTEIAYKNWHIGVQWLEPITQNLTGGIVEANNRWSMNINYGF